MRTVFFLREFRVTCRNDPYNIPLEIYENCATFLCRKFFQILYVIKLISNILNSVFANFHVSARCFGLSFQTICRIDAYDIPLERGINCTTLLWRSFFQIRYRFRLILDIRISVFAESFIVFQFLALIFRPFVGLMHVTYRWNRMKITQLLHKGCFSQLYIVLN